MAKKTRMSRSEEDLTQVLSKVAGLLGTSPASVMQLLEHNKFPEPKDRMIKISQIAAWFEVSETTIYKWIKAEQFPQPINLGHEDDPFATKRWWLFEVRDWLYGRSRGTGQYKTSKKVKKK